MEAFIALEKYIVNEEKKCGIGVPITLDEQIAMYESTRRKNVQSFNNWMLINVPGSQFFLDINKPIKEQSDEVLNCLMGRDFLMGLFIHEGKKLYSQMDSLLEGKDSKVEHTRLFDEFTKEKYDLILKIPSGQELFDFINSKCVTHDKGKSSALLYDSGIKGCFYHDETGERFLMFNAKKDIIPVEYRNAAIKDSNQIM